MAFVCLGTFMPDLRFTHIFIHSLKLAVPKAEAVAASILCATAAVAASVDDYHGM